MNGASLPIISTPKHITRSKSTSPIPSFRYSLLTLGADEETNNDADSEGRNDRTIRARRSMLPARLAASSLNALFRSQKVIDIDDEDDLDSRVLGSSMI